MEIFVEMELVVFCAYYLSVVLPSHCISEMNEVRLYKNVSSRNKYLSPRKENIDFLSKSEGLSLDNHDSRLQPISSDSSVIKLACLECSFERFPIDKTEADWRAP